MRNLAIDPPGIAKRFGDSLLEPFACSVAFVVGSMALFIVPFFVGVISDTLDFNQRQIGMLASADMAGMFVAALLAAFWIRTWSWRTVATLAMLLLVVTNLSTTIVQGHFPALVAMRVLSGVAGGSLLSIGLTGVGDTANPDRSIGGMNVGQALMAALTAWLIPRYLAAYGVDGLMYYLTVFAVVGLVFMQWLPRESSPVKREREPGKVSIGLAVTSTVAIFIFGAGMFTLWSYLERIGNAAGISAVAIGDSIATAFLVAILASLAATAIAGRCARAWPITLTVVFQVAAFFLLAGHVQPLAFLMAAMLITFVWYFSVPFQVGITVDVDPTGRFVVLFLMSMKGSYVVGPSIVSPFISAGDYSAVIIFAFLTALVAYLIFLALALKAPGRGTAISDNTVVSDTSN